MNKSISPNMDRRQYRYTVQELLNLRHNINYVPTEWNPISDIVNIPLKMDSESEDNLDMEIDNIELFDDKSWFE